MLPFVLNRSCVHIRHINAQKDSSQNKCEQKKYSREHYIHSLEYFFNNYSPYQMASSLMDHFFVLRLIISVTYNARLAIHYKYCSNTGFISSAPAVGSKR